MNDIQLRPFTGKSFKRCAEVSDVNRDRAAILIIGSATACTSPAMIRPARKRAPGATFVCGSFLTTELPACDAVTALGEVLNYRFDPKSGPRALERLFRRVHEGVGAGGMFVFDLTEPWPRRPGRRPPGVLGG